MHPATTNVRLLIIALDGADSRLLDQATQDGTLPNLTMLRRSGRAWPLASDSEATDDSLWASFQYGVDIGEHGRPTYFLDDDHGNRTFAPACETDRETFWDRLSAAGRRVAVFDVPKCRAPRPINGIHLTDWLVHGRYAASPQSYPATLADEVVARFGAAPVSRCGYRHEKPFDDETVAAIRQNLLRSVAMKRDAGLHFLSQAPWDLFIIGFKESHCSGHSLWHLHDPDHRDYDADRVARVGNPILDILQAQDAAVGDLVRQVGSDCQILVLTTSDYAPNGSLMHLFDRVAVRINDAIAAETDGRWQTGLRRLMRTPRTICRAVWRSDDAAALRVPRRPDDTDATHRARVEQVADLGRELVDASDGSKVIAEVTYPAFERSGSRAADLPHLVLHYRTNMCPATVASTRLGRITARPPVIRAGNHAPGGFVIATGPGTNRAANEVRSLMDIAATVTSYLSDDSLATPPLLQAAETD